MTALGTGTNHCLWPFGEAPDLGAGSGVDPEGVEDSAVDDGALSLH